jgi:hypothetical protein
MPSINPAITAAKQDRHHQGTFINESLNEVKTNRIDKPSK